MAIRKNPDGSITVGVIPEEKEPPKSEKAEAKKPTKKAKK